MRYFFDTEFIEDGRTIDLISIGIVAEDGREFYLENREADLSKANEWVQEHVLPHLKANDPDWPGVSVRREDIARHIQVFCDPIKYGKPEIWAYYADYDWVVFCQLFGRMIDLPKGFPMYCRDIKQEADRLQSWIRWFNADPDFKLKLPEQEGTEHDALEDARWNKRAYQFLAEQSGESLTGERASVMATGQALTVE